MHIDWNHFTPWASLAPRRGEIAWRVAFLAGLMLAPVAMALLGRNPVPRIEADGSGSA